MENVNIKVFLTIIIACVLIFALGMYWLNKARRARIEVNSPEEAEVLDKIHQNIRNEFVTAFCAVCGISGDNPNFTRRHEITGFNCDLMYLGYKGTWVRIYFHWNRAKAFLELGHGDGIYHHKVKFGDNGIVYLDNLLNFFMDCGLEPENYHEEDYPPVTLEELLKIAEKADGVVFEAPRKYLVPGLLVMLANNTDHKEKIVAALIHELKKYPELEKNFEAYKKLELTDEISSEEEDE